MFSEQTVCPIKNGLNRPHVVPVYIKPYNSFLKTFRWYRFCVSAWGLLQSVLIARLWLTEAVGWVIGSLASSKLRPLAWGPVKVWWHPGIWKIYWIVSLSLSQSLCVSFSLSLSLSLVFNQPDDQPGEREFAKRNVTQNWQSKEGRISSARADWLISGLSLQLWWHVNYLPYQVRELDGAQHWKMWKQGFVFFLCSLFCLSMQTLSSQIGQHVEANGAA